MTTLPKRTATDERHSPQDRPHADGYSGPQRGGSAGEPDRLYHADGASDGWHLRFRACGRFSGDGAAWAAYLNTLSRYVSIKEEQAHLAKEELLVLWTDYFKLHHLEAYPELHNTFWKAAKLCSAVKVDVSVTHAQELMDAIEEIHNIFWSSKNREVTYYTAS